MKYIAYFILGTIWYILFFFYANGPIWKFIDIIGYIIWLGIYIIYYIPIDKKYNKLIKDNQ